jgi:hypothetical protein
MHSVHREKRFETGLAVVFKKTFLSGFALPVV